MQTFETFSDNAAAQPARNPNPAIPMSTEFPRRQFLHTAALAGGALGFTAFAASRDERAVSMGPGATAAPDADPARIEKVKRALLAMQRRAWEQGTAA